MIVVLGFPGDYERWRLQNRNVRHIYLRGQKNDCQTRGLNIADFVLLEGFYKAYKDFPDLLKMLLPCCRGAHHEKGLGKLRTLRVIVEEIEKFEKNIFDSFDEQLNIIKNG